MVEETENRSKISIWWDIENCQVPKDVDPHFIAQNMTAALHHASLTGPIEIQVFGDTTLLPHITQKALSDTGITLNHVPRGNKDAADKAILVAMLLWALDNPPPANILLISGDGDFANALHRLRLKTYSILLAVPAQFVKPALTGAAKKLWYWKDMVKGQLAEPKLPHSSGSTFSQEAAGSIRSMNTFQPRQVSSSFSASVTHNSAVPKEYASPQKKFSEQEGANTAEHFRSLSFDNPSSFSSHGMSRSHSMENAHNVTSNRNNSPGGVSNISASNKLNGSASSSQRHLSGSSNSAACSMDFGQYPYFLPTQGENLEGLDSITSSAVSNNKEGSRPPQFTSSRTSSPLINNKEESGPSQFTSAMTSSALSNNKEESRPPHPAGLPSNNKEESRPPQFNSMPNRGANTVPSVKNTASVNHNAFSHKHKAFEYGNVMLPSGRPTTSAPPSKVMTSNPEKMSHETCLDKIFSAMKTLERDMLAPTEINLADCIRYWDPQYERVDVKQTLNRASELQQVTRTQLGGGLVMFFPPEHRVPWNCVDPGNMQHNHSGDIWLELQRFLLNGEGKQAFLSSCSRYDAALILKNACSMHIQSLVVGKILNLLQQAMQEKKWFKKNGAGWAPLVLNHKALQERSGQKRELKPSTSQELTDVAYVETTDPGPVNNKKVGKDSDAKVLRQIQVVRELKSWLSYRMTTVKDGYDISRVHQDFFQVSGKDLSKEGLDFSKLLKQFPDVLHVVRSPGGLWLAYPVSHGVNIGSKSASSVAASTS